MELSFKFLWGDQLVVVVEGQIDTPSLASVLGGIGKEIFEVFSTGALAGLPWHRDVEMGCSGEIGMEPYTTRTQDGFSIALVAMLERNPILWVAK